jgi:phenylpropionate dioxygenase-like ring-hydroxylating dioxygenase large terminal subunit
MNKHTLRTFVPTLPSSAYSDPERYRMEFAKIFRREWIYILHETQLPDIGSFETFEIGDVPLLIVRGTDDTIRAFYNVCQHRGHILAEGSGRATHFTCRYHAWTYQTDGNVRGAPGLRIQELPQCRKALRSIETKVRDGFVFVRLESGEDDFETKFADFFDELHAKLPVLNTLRFARRFTAEVDGNWKIMVENYLECYHCSPTHPALSELMCVPEFRIDQKEWFVSTSAPAGKPKNSAFNYTPHDGMQTEFTGWGLFPNLTFNIFPGQQNLLVFQMLPISAERSIGICDYFFVEGNVDDEAQALMDWEGSVLEKEDNELIVSAHRGMRSGALDCGVFVIDDANHAATEAPLAHFNRLIERAMSR